ncbi:MAG: hypothetical protein IT276_14825 [Ignavibacteriaceae bacterium]|nr:hypothetical protein [Ignavibacteriaceae bacterium]
MSAKKNVNTIVILTKGKNGRKHRMSAAEFEKNKEAIKKQGWDLIDDSKILKETDNPDEFIIKQ